MSPPAHHNAVLAHIGEIISYSIAVLSFAWAVIKDRAKARSEDRKTDEVSSVEYVKASLEGLHNLVADLRDELDRVSKSRDEIEVRATRREAETVRREETLTMEIGRLREEVRQLRKELETHGIQAAHIRAM